MWVSTLQASKNKPYNLQINVSKTEAMFFTRSNNHMGRHVFVAGEKIKVVFLGVELVSKFTLFLQTHSYFQYIHFYAIYMYCIAFYSL